MSEEIIASQILRDMRPRFSFYNCICGHGVDSEQLAKPHKRHACFGAAFSQFLNLFCCHFGINMALPYWSKVLGSFFSVFGVLKNCPGVKMRWIAARRIITFVQDEQSARNLAMTKCIGNSVGHSAFSIYANLTIAATAASQCPDPALPKFWGVRGNRAVLIYAFPKTLNTPSIQLERLVKFWDCFRRGNVFAHIVLSGPSALITHLARVYCLHISFHHKDNYAVAAI